MENYAILIDIGTQNDNKSRQSNYLNVFFREPLKPLYCLS